jgi:hypothetical protein
MTPQGVHQNDLVRSGTALGLPREHNTAKLGSGVTDMEKGRTDTVQKGLRRVKEAEQLLLDLERMSRQGTPDERRVARKLLEEYFPDY